MEKIKIMAPLAVMKGWSCNTPGYKCKFLGYGLDRSMCWFFEKKLKKTFAGDDYIYEKCHECIERTDMACKKEVQND